MSCHTNSRGRSGGDGGSAEEISARPFYANGFSLGALWPFDPPEAAAKQEDA